MKRNLFILLLMSFSIFNAQILSEDFQGTTFPPTGWTTATNVASRPWGFTTTIFTATGQTTFNITGGKSAAIGWIAEDQDAHLTSPAFSLVGYSSATLAFKTKLGYEYMVDPFPNGDLKVEVSTDGTTWNQVWVEEDYGLFTDYVTLDISIDLAAYLNNASVQIRFHYVGNDADSLSLDDVAVTGVLAVDDISTNDTLSAIYPNPVKSSFQVKLSEDFNAAQTSLIITDLSGKKVKEFSVADSYNISELPKGVYLLNVTDGKKSENKKLIKE